jgi:hypothetical protein
MQRSRRVLSVGFGCRVVGLWEAMRAALFLQL